MGWIRIFFYVAVRMLTALLAGVSLAWDVTGESFLTIPPGHWGLIGLIAFAVFVVITIYREIDLALQQRPKIEVKANNVVSRDITLIVHNKSNAPAIFSATMTPDFHHWEDRGKSNIQGLMNVAMVWEATGQANENIDANGQKLLKVCSVVEKTIDSSKLHFMEFAKMEFSKQVTIEGAHFSKGDAVPTVELRVLITANINIKGRRDWVFKISYVSGGQMLKIEPIKK